MVTGLTSMLRKNQPWKPAMGAVNPPWAAVPAPRSAADAVRRSLANGSMGGFGLTTDDCRKTYEELSAKGVVFVQEPAERPYGIEAVMRDNSGNWLVLVEPREFTPGDFTDPA